MPARRPRPSRSGHGLEALSKGRQVEVEVLDPSAGYVRLKPASLPIDDAELGTWKDVASVDPITRGYLHEARVRKSRWQAATPQARTLVLSAIRAASAIEKAAYYLLQGPGGGEPDRALQLAAEPFLRLVVRDFEGSRSDANGFQRQFERFVFLAKANDVLPDVERVLHDIRNEVRRVSVDDETWLPGAQARVQALLQARTEHIAAYEDMQEELKLLRTRRSTANIAVRIVARTSGLSEDDVRTGIRRFRPNKR